LSGGGKSQCEPGSNLGFVVHGLWPQYEHGYPSNCGYAPAPSRIALDRAKASTRRRARALRVAQAWKLHGTEPRRLFRQRGAREGQRHHSREFRKASSDENLATMDIERAFLDANPGCDRGC